MTKSRNSAGRVEFLEFLGVFWEFLEFWEFFVSFWSVLEFWEFLWCIMSDGQKSAKNRGQISR